MTTGRHHDWTNCPEWLLNKRLGSFALRTGLNANRFWMGSSFAIACLAMTATTGQAQNFGNSIGSPPPSFDQPTISVPPPPTIVPVPQAPSTAIPFQREAVFQAPQEPQRSNLGQYTVYVNGTSPDLLQQVQLVEPRAVVQQYQGREVIQVGTFNDTTDARRQVAALQAQGITAEIGYGSEFAQSSFTSFTKTSPYVVIIPGGQGELSTLAQQAMQLGVRQDAIRLKDAPLGWHLEIGPFGDYNEAKEVTQYLRKGGLDSRVYFNR